MFPTPATTAWSQLLLIVTRDRPTATRERRSRRRPEDGVRGQASTAFFSSAVITSRTIGRSGRPRRALEQARAHLPRGSAPRAERRRAPRRSAELIRRPSGADAESRSPIRRRGAPIACATSGASGAPGYPRAYSPGACAAAGRRRAGAGSGDTNVVGRREAQEELLAPGLARRRRRPSSTAGAVGSRPCGLLTNRTCPAISDENVRARRWTVCPRSTLALGARRAGRCGAGAARRR